MFAIFQWLVRPRLVLFAVLLVLWYCFLKPQVVRLYWWMYP
jgi:hypothetical protein